MSDTVYTCDNCPHSGDLMACHNCPNFEMPQLGIKRSYEQQFDYEDFTSGFLISCTSGTGAGSYISHEPTKLEAIKDFFKKYGKGYAITQIIDLSKLNNNELVIVEKRKLEEISNAISLALNVQCGIVALLTDEEIQQRIKNAEENSFILILLKAKEFCNEILKSR